MLADQIYAVVDIEATGGSVGSDERIIQIAVVLIKNNQVINHFNSLVNPGKKIPENIQKLTAITNKEVEKAPYFEEIAPVILRLLEKTIFVAHNVGFDYRFLNEQLILHGFEELSIPAIDTVELTQILYPTFDSFKLEEIAANLDYDLADAHDALADAQATVHIFKRLFQRAISLPLITLEKLAELAECTTHETALFFIDALEVAQKNPSDLPNDLVIVNQIAIQKPVQHADSYQPINQSSYPRLKKEKEQYLQKNQNYRFAQAAMMDLVYDYFQTELSLEKCAIEAPPGIGKTLAYLLPASFIAQPQKPIVISTYTTVLQEQLLNESIPQLEKMIGREIKTALVKSSRHYLSLSVFERWLKEITGKDSEAYLSMRILVWLTDTKTGDLTDINAGSHLDLEFWQEIRARKNQYADEHWREYDFYERIKEASNQAEFIVTNHHFLVHDWQSEYPILTNLERLIIDEAHHFPDIAIQATTINVKPYELSIMLDKMGSISNNLGIFKFMNDLYDMKIVTINELKVLNRTLLTVNENWQNLLDSLIIKFLNQEGHARSDSNFIEQEFTPDFLSMKEKRILKNIISALTEFIYISQEITIKSHRIFKDLTNENQLFLIELVNLINYLKDWKQNIEQIFNQKQTGLRWASYLPEQIESTFQFHQLSWGQENSFIDYLATHSKVVFTSSTLSYQNKEDYFSEQLKNLPMTYHQLESPFDYGQQVRVMLSKNSVHPRKIKPNEYANRLAESIGTILRGTKVNTIILFRSLALLEEVYHLLMEDPTLKQHLILAQSISGTPKRILKNFKNKRPAVILGSDSFFEGIDLPDDELELLILTRLPFPAPNTPLTRLKTNALKEQAINPFLGEYLPRAVLKFRQAFGRLIRSSNDRGVMVILDERFLSASYANQFKEAIPQGIEFEVLEEPCIAEEIDAFITKKDES